MKKWFKDWTPLPADMVVQMFPLVLIVIAVLSSVLLPILHHLRRADAWIVFGVSLGLAVVGVVLLFCARFPLYRQGQFFSFGSRLLDASHRRLYRLSYGFILVAVFVLLILLVTLR